MLMFGVQTAEDRFARVISRKETLGKPADPMIVVDFRQVSPDNFAARERVQEPVPEQDVLGAELADVAVGAQQKVVLVVKRARGGGQALQARARVGARARKVDHWRPLEVGKEAEQVVGSGLQGLQRLKQDGAHLLKKRSRQYYKQNDNHNLPTFYFIYN
jgi:hypothetical protein